MELSAVRPVSIIPLWRLVWIVACVSAGLLGFEISLMRILLVASWHHFAFLVIGVALLGFGASGTVLCIFREWLMKRGEATLFVLTILTAMSMPICMALAQQIPIEARFVPTLLLQQLGNWVLYWLLLAVPFLLGSTAIGLALMLAADRVALVYAANLAGSGIGAVLVTAAMYYVPPPWLPLLMCLLAIPGVLAVPCGSLGLRVGAMVTAIACLTLWLWADPPQIRSDPFKYLAHVRQLEQQHVARRLAAEFSPRSTIEIYRGDVFHEFNFLSVDAIVPEVDVILMDGHLAGSMLRVDRVNAGDVVEHTMMSVAYALLPQQPRVLLLGEVGGGNVWLAQRHGAASIQLIQPDQALLRLLNGPLRHDTGRFLALPTVEVFVANPRHFVEHTSSQFDLIQLVSMESMTAGSGGIGGLSENYLITVEGLTASLRALTEHGVLSVCRGIQDPPRDNLKILTTLVESLRRLGVSHPEDHIVIVRDFLAVCTLVKRTPWSPQQIETVRDLCSQRDLTPVWFTGIRDNELNYPDEMPGPSGALGDWYHEAARQLFSPDSASTFIDDWMFDIRPTTDSRPFFLDFCKLRSIGALRKAFGEMWLTRAELAYLFVLCAAALVATVSVLLTIVPLLLLRSIRRSPGKRATAAYFGAIGLGYLLLEMVVMSALTHLIGDPIHAAALTIATFLLFSGLGSMLSQRLLVRSSPIVRWLFVALVIFGAVDLIVILPVVNSWAGAFSFTTRCALGVLPVAPLAFLMGFPMPSGLYRLNCAAPVLIPWAWGVNGFASVLAPPLAIALAMTWSYHITASIALLMYVAATLLLPHLPSMQDAATPTSTPMAPSAHPTSSPCS